MRSYLSQDWPEKELIVIDDGFEPVDDLIRSIPGATYIRIADKLRIGAKRNLACECAKGEFIVHIDDDDWSNPQRISQQVALLKESGKGVTGYRNMLFWDEQHQQASRYSGAFHYALGTSLCYARKFWEQHRFQQTDLGEDNEFVTWARDTNALVSADGGKMMVATIHPGNTCSRQPLPWPAVDKAEIPQAFFEAFR